MTRKSNSEPAVVGAAEEVPAGWASEPGSGLVALVLAVAVPVPVSGLAQGPVVARALVAQRGQGWKPRRFDWLYWLLPATAISR